MSRWQQITSACVICESPEVEVVDTALELGGRRLRVCGECIKSLAVASKLESKAAEAVIAAIKRETAALEARLEAANAELAANTQRAADLEAELESVRGRNEHREELLGRISSLAQEMTAS